MNRIECYQAASVALDSWACGYEAGRSKIDIVYQEVVEGRDVPATYKTYSSCADRAAWKLWRLGCRRRFLNREARTPAPHDWHPGVNIAWLHDPSRGSPVMATEGATRGRAVRLPIAPGVGWVPMAGDELIIWTHPRSDPSKEGLDAHSLSILDFDGGEARTANYGASGMSERVFPGAKISEAPLVLRGRLWVYGKPGHEKQVMRVLRIEDYIETLTAPANLEGIPFDARYTGEVRDFIEHDARATE